VAETLARLIALYLPLFHPIPENDEWWGKGFTEWTNVSKAEPLFEGHYRPHIPANLGFCDLRVPEARQAQANLVEKCGIEGFCYWRCSFEGKRLLERPFNEVLFSGQPDLLFCLAWANEPWSRRWLGEERDVLQKQTYSLEDDHNHIQWLIGAFSDPRYIRVEGRLLFLIYRPLDLPAPKRTIEIFRNQCARSGVSEPYLLGINAHSFSQDCRVIGFDGNVDFEPQLGVLPDSLRDGLKIYDYVEARQRMTSRERSFPIYPCLSPRWDNTPRRGGDGIVLVNATPENFESGLREIVQSALHKPYGDRLVFINAWNEWAEGNHLEPDLEHGLEYLEAVRRVTSVENA
jgi:lipopolysaccharide biosynthesis protein